MFAQVAVKLSGPMDHLRLVWQVGETLLMSVEFDDDPEGSRYNVLLALQEMLTNVLRHGYRLDESKPIEIVFGLHDERLVIELRDEGPEFDPLSYDTTRVDENEDMPTTCGGHGIRIACLVMDSVDYARENGRNVLRLTKCVRAIVNS